MSELFNQIAEKCKPESHKSVSDDKRRLYVFEKDGKRETEFAEDFTGVFTKRPELKTANFKAIHKTL